MNRIWLILAILPFLIAGCAAPNVACLFGSDSCIAWYADGKVTGYLEMVNRDGYVWGRTEGEDWKCRAILQWTNAEWCKARKELGIPLDLCVQSASTGEWRCAPCKEVR